MITNLEKRTIQVKPAPTTAVSDIKDFPAMPDEAGKINISNLFQIYSQNIRSNVCVCLCVNKCIKNPFMFLVLSHNKCQESNSKLIVNFPFSQ